MDDDENIAQTLSEILRREGHLIAVAFSGEEAVERATEFLPDLLVSDIDMCAMDGIEVAARITERLPGCRVLFHSGRSATSDMMDALPEDLVYSFISKPTRVPELLNAISYMLPAVKANRRSQACMNRLRSHSTVRPDKAWHLLDWKQTEGDPNLAAQGA